MILPVLWVLLVVLETVKDVEGSERGLDPSQGSRKGLCRVSMLLYPAGQFAEDAESVFGRQSVGPS